MQPAQGAPGGPRIAGILRWLVALTFGVLAVLLVVIYSHVLTSDNGLVAPAELLAVALLTLALASIGAGIVYALKRFPQHRFVIYFVVAITLATLLAHAYIMGTPAAMASGATSGLAGSSFSDGNVRVDSTLSGQSLQITVSPSGGDALANINVTSSNASLSGPGFSPSPTLAAPLEPGSSAMGNWTIISAGSNASITVSYQHLTCYSTGSREYGCIMDEVFYIPEAMGILNGQQCTAGGLAPHNCHMEHPYLVPALMAAGMAVFGEYNVVGWRLMPALLGAFSIPLLFGIAWKVSGSKKAAYLSATLLALDVMFFSQSSAGLLDIPEVFFGLAAFFAYFAGLRVWKLDKYVIAGVFLGVAGLAKETAIFMALALLTWILIFDGGGWRGRVYSVMKVALVIVVVFSVGLQAYDSALVVASPAGTTGCQITNNTFIQHVGYMLCYGSSLIAGYLECQGGSHGVGYWCKYPNDPGGPPILPTDWLVYYSPVEYFASSVTVCPNTVNGVCKGGAYSYVSVAYYGITNLLETWTVFVWVPLAAYALYRYFRRKQPSLEQFGFEETGGSAGLEPETKFAALALVYFLWTYVPYLFLLVAERVTYPFYFVPAIPAVAMGCAYWLSRKWFPRWLMVIFVIMVFVFFFIYFPVKAFLPDWLRVLIRH
jgi:hypothetical protein